MKRKILLFVLGIVYMVLLTLLILSMVRISALETTDSSAGWNAVVGAVLIGIPRLHQQTDWRRTVYCGDDRQETCLPCL